MSHLTEHSVLFLKNLVIKNIDKCMNGLYNYYDEPVHKMFGGV